MIRTELYNLLVNANESYSEFMGKALNKNFLDQYKNDSVYSIDNMVTERAIRLITVQRRNSLFFAIVKGIQNSVVYNALIATYKQVEIFFKDYFCRLFRELKKGRADYEDFLPRRIYK